MKFWNLKAIANQTSAELRIDGEILSGGMKWDETDVTISDFNEAIDGLAESVNELNMRINSPGGSVFTTIAMMNRLKRLKSERNITINAYIDGIGASSASMLPMVADNVYMYSNSFLMVHKPMVTIYLANINDLKEAQDFLEKTEENMVIPTYKAKGKSLTDEKIADLLNGEDNWLSAKEASEIFEIDIIEEKFNIVANFDIEKSFKEIPNEVKALFSHPSTPSMSVEEKELREKIISDSKANLTYLNTIL